MNGMQYQLQIYMNGLQNNAPKHPVAFEALEQKASKIMTPEAFAYVAGGAGAEDTIQNNRHSFSKWQILPHMLNDVSQRNTSIEIFGTELPTPLLLAPVGVLGIVHAEAELAVARAAVALKIPQIVSTVSSTPIEKVAEIHKDHPHWFQLYWGKDDEFTKSLITRAENSGYGAIVVTLDTRLLAWRERDIQLAYLPFLKGEGLSNYFTDPVFLAATGDPGQNKMKAIAHFADLYANTATTWKDIAVIRNHTNLPVILKGILHPEDAIKAADHGIDGIIVSNHGGRQLDGAIGSLHALELVAAAARDKTTILFDSGIRRGADVFKAMALGAKAVLVGRPYVYGLALDGAAGVQEVLQNLLADIDLTMGLAGCRSWAEVTQDKLIRV